MIVDYYSNNWEVDALHSISTAAVIKRLKPRFARWGISNKVVSNNGPQFVSNKFQNSPSNGIFAISPAQSITANPMEKLSQQ